MAFDYSEEGTGKQGRHAAKVAGWELNLQLQPLYVGRLLEPEIYYVLTRPVPWCFVISKLIHFHLNAFICLHLFVCLLICKVVDCFFVALLYVHPSWLYILYHVWCPILFYNSELQTNQASICSQKCFLSAVGYFMIIFLALKQKQFLASWGSHVMTQMKSSTAQSTFWNCKTGLWCDLELSCSSKWDNGI